VSQSTPKPYPQPTVAPVTKPRPTAARTPAGASIVPGAGATAGREGDGTSGSDPDGTGGAAGIIIALGAAVGGGVLMTVAMRRMRSEAPEGETEDAGPEPMGGEMQFEPPTLPPAPSSEPAEAHLPRWLRPSVRASRFDAVRDTTPSPGHERLTFDGPAEDATERSTVRYDLVPLLDRPDEALGMRHGELDSGDEVEILEREATWVQVRTPTGASGWVPAMTLTSADAFAQELETQMRAAAEIEAGTGQDDQPGLETLLAIAAQRRAQLNGDSPPAPYDAPDPRQRSRSKRKRTILKPKRWTSSARG
jgi:hypothetical protein